MPPPTTLFRVYAAILIPASGDAFLNMNGRPFTVCQTQHQLPAGQIQSIQSIHRRRGVLGPVKIGKAKSA